MRAFDALSERQREVVDLVDLQGYRAAEAAELMGIAPGTARATLFQARKALRTQLLDRRADVIELLRDA